MHLVVKLRMKSGRAPPYDHNFILGSAVYNHLRQHSDRVLSALHDSPKRSPYVLSELFPSRNLPGHWSFRVGSSNYKLVNLISECLPAGTPLQISESRYEVTDVSVDDVPCNPGEYLTLSPILLRDSVNRKSIVCDFPDYPRKLEEAMNVQIQNNLQKDGSMSVRHFEPLGVRKRRIKDKTVLAQKGRMLIIGPQDEIRFLVDHGVGLSPALAFGFIVPTDRMDYS